jgi:hypothetical protein
MSGLILYTTQDGRNQIQLRAKSETVWLSQRDMAELFEVLTHAGTVSHAQMEARTNTLYLDFDQRRKQQEAQQADRQDEAELKAVETKIKHRSKK